MSYSKARLFEALGMDVEGRGKHRSCNFGWGDAATRVWFHQLRWLTCRRAPLTICSRHLGVTECVASLYVARDDLGNTFGSKAQCWKEIGCVP